MSRKALLVGINYIQHPDIQLNGCISDTKNMQTMLRNVYGYDNTNIVSLRDDYPAMMPSRRNILAQLSALVYQSAQLSEIWFHYSGHGSQIRDLNGDEVSGLDDILVPSDYDSAGIITDDELYSLIQQIKCPAMILIDSCHSGSACDLPWSFTYTNPSQYMRTQIGPNKRAPMTNPKIYMFSGCKDSQSSADSYDDTKQEYVGAFTNAFINCLQKTQYNRPILLLYRDVCMNLAQNGFPQVPVLSSSSASPTYQFAKRVATVMAISATGLLSTGTTKLKMCFI